jgi:GT2 family glycosyltransferase
MDHPAPSVSVIIPVYKQWALLERCLGALLKQSVGSPSAEILVVNNDPVTACPFPLVEQFPQVHWLTEEQPGSYAARNRGILVARGSILAFTDADCLPSPDWLAQGVSFLKSNPGVSRIGGRIQLFTEGPHANWAENFERAFAFRQDSAIRRHGSAVTANMMAWRRVFDRVGLFDEGLFSGGDHEWGKRAQRRGERIAYCPETVVAHPARSSVRALLRKHRRIVLGKIATAEASWGATREIGRSLPPPVLAFLDLRSQNRLSLKDCLRACCVLYLLRLYRVLVILGFKVRLVEKPRE